MYLFTHPENQNHISHIRAYKFQKSGLYVSYMSYMVQNKTYLDFYKKIKTEIGSANEPLFFALVTTAITAFLYEILTLEFCATHDYSVMKSFFPLLLLAVFFIIKIPQKSIKIGLLTFITLLNIAQYYYINRIGAYNQNGDRYDAVQRIGTIIAAHSSPDDLVLLSGFEMNAQLLYYAKHNIETLNDSTEIVKILQKHERKTAIWVKVAEQKVVEIDTLIRLCCNAQRCCALRINMD